jgi:hypothetical protein
MRRSTTASRTFKSRPLHATQLPEVMAAAELASGNGDGCTFVFEHARLESVVDWDPAAKSPAPPGTGAAADTMGGSPTPPPPPVLRITLVDHGIGHGGTVLATCSVGVAPFVLHPRQAAEGWFPLHPASGGGGAGAALPELRMSAVYVPGGGGGR